MMPLNDQLAVLTALQKAVKATLDDVRRQADEEMLSSYDEDGVTKRALKVGGQKVGDYSVSMAAGHWEVDSMAELEEFALNYGFATYRNVIPPHHMYEALCLLEREAPELLQPEVQLSKDWESLVQLVGGVPTFLDSGLPVPGIRWVEARPKGTQVRGCKPEDVIPAVRELGGVDHILFGLPAESEEYQPKEI